MTVNDRDQEAAIVTIFVNVMNDARLQAESTKNEIKNRSTNPHDVTQVAHQMTTKDRTVNAANRRNEKNHQNTKKIKSIGTRQKVLELNSFFYFFLKMHFYYMSFYRANKFYGHVFCNFQPNKHFVYRVYGIEIEQIKLYSLLVLSKQP